MRNDWKPSNQPMVAPCSPNNSYFILPIISAASCGDLCLPLPRKPGWLADYLVSRCGRSASSARHNAWLGKLNVSVISIIESGGLFYSILMW